MDRGVLVAADSLLLSDAAADAKSGTDPGQHQLRLGHERPRRPDLGARFRMVHRTVAWLAAPCLRAHALRAGALDAEGTMMLAPTAATPTRPLALRLAFRFAWRELRGGLRGFGVFIACIALGVMAIAGVGSVAASLNDGISGAGRVILGGDLAFSLIQREADDAERAFLAA